VAQVQTHLVQRTAVDLAHVEGRHVLLEQRARVCAAERWKSGEVEEWRGEIVKRWKGGEVEERRGGRVER
jgi:hypothetical protein